MSDRSHPGGLSSGEAAKRLQQLGPAEDPNSRSVASIVAGNVFTLFNAIIGVFFILILGLGLFADALFGFIAIINSYIGIRQELKAKEMLESLALLVAPRAKAIRDGAVVEVGADEVVPGDFVRVEPGDQLVADGEVVESRGLTLDESMLTGEADGVRKPGWQAIRSRFTGSAGVRQTLRMGGLRMMRRNTTCVVFRLAARHAPERQRRCGPRTVPGRR